MKSSIIMNFSMRIWLSLAIIGSSVIWQDSSRADLTSPAHLTLLTDNSDLIVVGRIIKARFNEYPKPKSYDFPGYIASQYSSDYQQIGDEIFTIKVDRTIKGTSVSTLNCTSPFFLDGNGASGGSEKTYGIFFLKRNSQGQLIATDAMHLGVIAAPKSFISRASSSGIVGVATELANVLATPASVIIDPNSGVGPVNFSVSNSGVFKAESVYDQALNGLFYFPASIRLPLLKKVAQGSGGLVGRLLATSAALKDGDDTLLPKFVPLLMKPNPNIGSFTLLRLESGIQSIDTPKLVPTLTTLLGSPLVEMRRGAAVGLGGIAESFPREQVPVSITSPLVKALQDPDYMVRYHAVIALHSASEKCDSPAFSFYEGSEEKYLSCWRKWAVEKRK